MWLGPSIKHGVPVISGFLHHTRSPTNTHLTYYFGVETLGDPYYKRVPLPRVPEYRNLIQDSKMTKPSVKFAAVEPNIISDYPNGYRKIFGRRRAPITPACE
jgi:hypothetical protein